MIESEIHKLKKPEQRDFVLDTIDAINENFEKIDKLIDEKATYLNAFLKEGVSYPRGKKIWNDMPEIDSYIGWVNVRTGLFAPTWQERTTYNIGDKVFTKENNGHIYECIEGGVSGVKEPQFPTATNGLLLDYRGVTTWTPNKVYEVDDIVISTNNNTAYYYKCITRGTSNTDEPAWSTTSGTTITDGSVVWQSYRTVKWKEVGASCNFRPFATIL